ncbi:hypothetical protein NQ317_002408 [Molorchus minor]|uniref:Uncharacterized protein n=1 Tax=Molorchus minor TaxID=1323400 RepID=A0ABQ9JJW3_9CUCU|nr:hypothetical protein NQ317_002408 [Molorchus minor]
MCVLHFIILLLFKLLHTKGKKVLYIPLDEQIDLGSIPSIREFFWEKSCWAERFEGRIILIEFNNNSLAIYSIRISQQLTATNI